MKRRRNKGFLLLTLIFLIGVLLLVSEACEPELPLQIENRTDMTLTIYVEGVNDGQVEPNNSIEVKNLAAIFSYLLIEAKNSEGETVCSREFSITELHDADWKVVIPPSSE
jgi:hypothetical protein